MNLSKRIAYACALVPMLLSIAVFLVWLTSRSQMFLAIGLVTILIANLLPLLGGMALVNYVRLARQRGDQKSIWRQWSFYLVPILLLANTPLGLAMVSFAMHRNAEILVTITNRMAHPVDDHSLTGGDVKFELPPLGPDESVTRSFYPEADGSFEYRWQARDSEQSETFGYITPGLGGNWKVDVQGDEIRVQER
ncbi:MAG: hypothetical protein WD045_04140 [Pirellulaceae bacterium]